MGRRLVAALVDLALVPVVVVVAAEVTWRAGLLGLLGVSDDGWASWSLSFSGVAWTVAAAGVAYHALFTVRWGATPGKRLAGLRVEALGGGPVEPRRAVGRAACSAAVYLPWVVGPLLVTVGWVAVTVGSRRSFADRAAGTSVVPVR